MKPGTGPAQWGNSGCKSFFCDNTGGALGSVPPGIGVSNTMGRLAEATTTTNCIYPITQSSILTDEWFGYDARGEQTDLYESTPNSGGYYHSTASFLANGVVSQLTGADGYYMTWGVDAEGRISSTYTPYGQNPVTSTSFNAASQPTQVNFGSGDSDNFTYDPNTDRMTQYKYTVGGQSVIGNLTWNALGTLGSLAITDPFNSSDAQTCSYSHDDLSRIASASCGSIWSQTFNYDAFGNIQKSGNSNFSATYSATTNQMTSIGGSTPSYDGAGNVTYDFLHAYSWNAYGRPYAIDGVGVTYDAFGRAVEENRGGTYTQMTYSPSGFNMQLMNGMTFVVARVPLPSGAMALYTPSGTPSYYRHSDWLGSSRLATTPSQTMYSDSAYAPFGEVYAQAGTADESFTGMDQDTSSNLYDFPAREYGIQGRWPSPDPAGLAAVDPTDPQTWNRYAYVRNSPLSLTDPTGMDPDSSCNDPNSNCTCDWENCGGEPDNCTNGEVVPASCQSPGLPNCEVGPPDMPGPSPNPFGCSPAQNSGGGGAERGTSSGGGTTTKAPTGPFYTLDCAGYQAAKNIATQTKSQGIEFGGLIYRNTQNGSFSYSAPFSGTPGALPTFDIHMKQDTPSGFALVGWYHFHPQVTGYPSPNLFSGADLGVTRRVGGPGYLLTPDGTILKLQPYPPNGPPVAPNRVPSTACQKKG